jgi:transposase InsO family protein
MESCAMDQRVAFIADWLSRHWTVVELSERYGVSRKTAHKWIGRYRAEGSAGLAERSHAPQVHGRATPEAVVEAIVQLKLLRPSWGPLKIIGWLRELHPEQAWPAPSTAGEILKRAGLVQPRRRRYRTPPTLGGLTLAERPNHLWAVDHKGWVRLGDGGRCEPLTLTDSFSRFLIALEACASTREAEARPVFERAFAEYGLPEAIRSDNGAPFASTGITGLTALSIWWAKLGIRHERIWPGKPQQNGRHERFHLTLQEAMQPPSADRAAQAERFRRFRDSFNLERPHQALGQTPPARHYQPSPRPLPKRLPEPDYPQEADVRRVRSNGEIKWGGQLIFVSTALVGERVAIEETDDEQLLMRFYDTPIGVIDPRQKRLRRLSLAARGEAQTSTNLSPIHPV